MFLGKKFLFKESKTTLGELWAEKIAAELGTLLGLEMMHVQFARKNGVYGVILENFAEDEKELRDGGDLLSRSIANFKVNSLIDYTIVNIMMEISKFQMEKKFIEMCIFDVLIASTDRHCENWGLLYINDKCSFAPIFDNGDALGFNLSDETLMLYKKDVNAFQAFTNRAKTQIEVSGQRKPKVTQLLNFLYDHYQEIVEEVINNFKVFDCNEISIIINKVPDEIMSIEQKEWVHRLVSYRHKWITEYKWRGV